MKIIKLLANNIIYLLCYYLITRSEIAEANNSSNHERNSLVTLLDRHARLNVVSFEPVGQDIALGLDFLLPFLKVPMIREVDAYGNEPALVNINSAAVLSTGLLTASSLLVSYIIKSYVIFGNKETKGDDEEKEKEQRRNDQYDLENEFWNMLNNFKLVYRNASGVRVDSAVPSLLQTIDETFRMQNIDLSSCMKKALCNQLQNNVFSKQELSSWDNGWQKIVTGLWSLEWFKQFLRRTSFGDTFDVFDDEQFPTNSNYCQMKFSKCLWSNPQDHFMRMMRTYVKFT